MAKLRLTPPLLSPRMRTHRVGSSNGNGNGSQVDGQETIENRVQRIETILERMQQTLDTQFKRMSDLAALIDRLNAVERR